MVVLEVKDAAGFASAMKAAAGKLVVVDFFATWCNPCKTVAPIFDGLSTKFAKEAVFLKLDVDVVREVAQAAGVKSLPSFGYYHNSTLIELQVGGDPRLLETKIKTHSEKYSSYAFKGAGHSMVGGASAAAAAPVAAAAAAKPNGPSAGGARKNPWADPNFALAKKAAAGDAPTAAAAKPAAAAAASAPKPIAATPAPKPAAAAAPAPVAKPAVVSTPSAAKPAAAAAPSAAASERVNPWATKEVPGASAAAPAAASAQTAPVATTPAPAATSAAAAPAAAAVTDGAAALPSAAAPASATPAAAASSSTPASSAAGPAVNDPSLTKQLNAGFLSSLQDMGFSRLRAEKALILTGNKSVEPALTWLMENETAADIDEPLQVVGSQSTKGPKGIDLDDMDEDDRAIYESLQSKKLGSSGVAFAGGVNQKVSTSNMTSEEKMAWLATRRAEVKARKEQEAIETLKEKEKSRKNTVKSVQALQEASEARERKLIEDAARKKKLEEDATKKAKAETLRKIAEEKERRREMAKREAERIAALKAAEAAKPKK